MPQIEIMQADLPHTLFNRKAGKGKKGRKAVDNENYIANPNDKAFALQREAVERRRRQMEAEGKDVNYTMDEIFNK